MKFLRGSWRFAKGSWNFAKGSSHFLVEVGTSLVKRMPPCGEVGKTRAFCGPALKTGNPAQLIFAYLFKSYVFSRSKYDPASPLPSPLWSRQRGGGGRPGQPREGVPDRAPGPVLAPGPAEPGPGADPGEAGDHKALKMTRRNHFPLLHARGLECPPPGRGR